MTKDDVIRMAREADDGFHPGEKGPLSESICGLDQIIKFAELVAKHERKACVTIIENYEIPVGNSAAGELACQWTYDALMKIRDDIRARGES